MLSQIEASGQIGRFSGDFARSGAPRSSGDRRPAITAAPHATACVVHPASYQSLLASLGLHPDPRLCVPAVRQ